MLVAGDAVTDFEGRPMMEEYRNLQSMKHMVSRLPRLK
jgi:hypothetical protein